MKYLYDFKGDMPNLYKSKQGIQEIISQVYKQYMKRPGFFAPYDNRLELGSGLIAPVYYPLEFSIMSGMYLATIGFILIGLLADSFLALKALVLRDSNSRQGHLDQLRQGSLIISKLLCGSLVCSVLALLSIPLSIASIITRSGASIIAMLTTDSKDDNNKKPGESNVVNEPVANSYTAGITSLDNRKRSDPDAPVQATLFKPQQVDVDEKQTKKESDFRL